MKRNLIAVVAVAAYPSPGEVVSPFGGFVRSIAKDLKVGDADAVATAAAAMAPHVPRGATLVPVPGHRGSSSANLALAEAIAKAADAKVADGLGREPSESQYARRKAGKPPLAPGEIRMAWHGRRPAGVVLLIDNVVTTGATAEAAARALGGGVALLAWADAGAGAVGRRANPGRASSRDARGLEEERFAAAVRRELVKALKAPGGPPWGREVPGDMADPRAFVAWARRRSPGAFQRALDGTAGRPLRPRAVEPVQPLRGVPRLVWHGTLNRDRMLLDGVRSPPAIDMGLGGKRGWGWSKGYAWSGIVTRWYRGLTDEGRESLRRQTGGGSGELSADELGRRVSLLFVMTESPAYALAYAVEPGGRPEGVPVLELDTSRLPLLGWIDDPYVMGGAMALVLPARGYQGGPDAVVAVRRPLPAVRRRKGGG